MKRLFILIAILFLALSVSSCGGDQTAIDRADAERIRKEALTQATNEAQERRIENDLHLKELERIEYMQALFVTWQPRIEKVGNFAISFGGSFLAFTTSLSLAYSLSMVIIMSGKSLSKAMEIRAGVVPVSKETGLERTVIMDIPKPVYSPETSSVLAKVQKLTGIRIYNPHAGKWTATNYATGEVIARLDENKPADKDRIEVNRQALLHWQTAHQQNKSGFMSNKGHVAAEIGKASPEIPGKPVNVDSKLEVEQFITLLEKAIENVLERK